jgi:hypothetical protein
LGFLFGWHFGPLAWLAFIFSVFGRVTNAHALCMNEKERPPRRRLSIKRYTHASGHRSALLIPAGNVEDLLLKQNFDEFEQYEVTAQANRGKHEYKDFAHIAPLHCPHRDPCMILRIVVS